MSEQIKILVDCHVFDGTFQGTTTYIKGLYSNFIKNKSYHFYLASNDSRHLQLVFGTHDNVTYLKYKSESKYIRLLFDVPAIIKKHNIKFAHFQYIVPPFKTCRYIVTLHDILFMEHPKYFPFRYRFKNKFLFKWSALQSDIILTVSAYSKNMIQNYFEIDDIVVTPNAVDPIFYEKYNKDEVQNKIHTKYGLKDYWIYVSRWEPRKNHLSLLRVFVENHYYERYSLVFVGNDAIKNSEYDEYYDGLSEHVKSRIIRLKKIDFDELVLILRGASLAVYPSFAEGFGIPPLEALAANVPSICSNTTGMSDFTFMNAMRFKPDDLIQLKNCIDANLNSSIEMSVIEEMKKTYNWDNSVSKLRNAIENML